MSIFADGKTVMVKYVSQEMMDWLDESDIKYYTTPHLERWKYSGCFGKSRDPWEDQNITIQDSAASSDYRRTGDDIIFEKEEDRMHFEIRWAEDIKTGDDLWNL